MHQGRAFLLKLTQDTLQPDASHDKWPRPHTRVHNAGVWLNQNSIL